jgi:hypothetical protein
MMEETLPTPDYYKVLAEDGIEQSIQTTDGKSIPLAIGNRDYQTFLKVDTDAKLCKRTELRTDEAKWAEIRAKRDRMLAECDWVVLPDAPLTEARKVTWQAYRQVLRDIPSTYVLPEDVEFPFKPE